MPIATVAALVEELRRLRLLAPAQLVGLGEARQRSFPNPRALAQHLLQQGLLTPYQLNRIFGGHGAELVVGPYLMLERLGEGGMGQVFKARHLRLDRIVAVKLIRKDRLGQADAVERFRREVQAAAQLAHPNVVLALDGDEIGSTLYFTMEYIEGIDLARLVRETGPQDIAMSCSFIRQAALGLQHIHEHGLVHRDIKPSNLMISHAYGQPSGGVVKILDLGLARLRWKNDPNQPALSSSDMITRAGLVIGTPEFIAPEQAVNAHGADIRADLYSLGCTFYFLLAGKPPFRQGTPLETLFAHRFEEPVPVDQHRPEVPPAVATIVHRLMAKAPADRFQTPGELAAALLACANGCSSSALVPTSNDTSLPTLITSPVPIPLESRPAQADQGRAARPRRGHRLRPALPGAFRANGSRWLPRTPQRRLLLGAGSAFILLITVSLVWSLLGNPWPTAVAAPESARLAPSSLPGVGPIYRKKATRVETILGTLEANGLPTLQGKWYCIGPFDVPPNSPAHGLGRPFPPESEIDLGKTYPVKDNVKVGWKEMTTFTVGKIVNLRQGPNYDHVAVYLLHEIDVKEPIALPVSLGCDDTMNVWLNDELVASKKVGGRAEPDQVITLLKLRPGKNRLLAKVCNDRGEYAFYICPQWPDRLATALASRLDRDFPNQPNR
ncbi:hypothetical protein AYO44_06415 [Planctomycetaceae bacterium SCGC AG-212-F19]|nr:hypothetical protein AYO44_06415 [Planctomycetaceae bacterium SCGC AG-212-F19]